MLHKHVLTFILGGILGCVSEVSPTGQTCPCPQGWLCSAVDNTCMKAGLAGPIQEDLSIPSDWSVVVYRDFSEMFEYRASNFLDNETLDNHPSDIVALSEPFSEGLAILAGTSVLELSHPSGYVEHDYRPAVANGSGPDGPRTIAFSPQGIPDLHAEPLILMGSASSGSGDGLYFIGADWNLTLISPDNNVRMVAADPEGWFFQGGTPANYYSPDLHIRRVQDGTIVLPNRVAHDGEPSQSGTMVLVTEVDGTFALEVVKTATESNVLMSGFTQPPSIVAGDVSALGVMSLSLIDNQALHIILEDETTCIIATNNDGRWLWRSGVFVPKGTLTNVDENAVFILQSSLEREEFRVLQFVVSPVACPS